MPSSQKGDASTEDQTSQAEEILAKNTGKKGAPVAQPPGKGASKRKGKKPLGKFPGFLQVGAQYTGPCLRKAVRYLNEIERSQYCTFIPFTKRLPGRKHCRMWATHTGHGNRHMRQEERDVWCR